MKKIASLEEIFKPGGTISSLLEEYEYRAGQLQMAFQVTESFRKGKHLLIEAGTGTGKTLAYLLPAILSEERVVISTGTKNLQEQLRYKDIPLLQNKLGLKFKALVVKGRANYLCIKRIQEFAISGELTNKNEIDYFKTVETWSRITKTGDIAEVDGIPENPSFWHAINARTEICLGTRCALFQECYVTKLKRQAATADLILTNHHLLFADLSIKVAGYGEALPDFRYLILDEAHLIEPIAASCFGTRVSNYQVRELCRDIKNELIKRSVRDQRGFEIIARLENESEAFFNSFSSEEERYRIDKIRYKKEIRESYLSTSEQLTELIAYIKAIRSEINEFEPLERRTIELFENIKSIIESDRRDHVYWADIGQRVIALNSTPLVINSLMQDTLFNKLNSAILTSATLSMAGSFDHIKIRLGLNNAATKMIPSEYDFSSRALLYLPEDLPLPSEENFYEKITRRAIEIFRITEGRAFLLFTSFSGMEKAYSILKNEKNLNIVMQGQDSKSALLEKFRIGKKMVLLGTMSFWQGIDVKGKDLICVIIDKLPFAVPTEPVVSATIEFIKSKGGNPFNEYQLPNAVMYLKQGLGRLIRHSTDYGIAAVMDKRICTRPYGKIFLDSLPPFKRTSNLNEIEIFIKSKL